jgi:hypothetical protein
MSYNQKEKIVDAIYDMVGELSKEELNTLEDLIVNGEEDGNLIRDLLNNLDNLLKEYRSLRSRYGDPRYLKELDKNWFSLEGSSPYVRVGSSPDDKGVDYFDPRGGPFIQVGEDYGFGKVKSIKLLDSGKEGWFKIGLETYG